MTFGTSSSHANARLIIGLLLGLFYVAWIAYYRNSLLADPDTAWHIVAGRDMWQSMSFPTLDGYSYTFKGEPWIAKEWLSQILLYAGYAVSGWTGPAALAIASTWAFFVMIYGLAARHLKPPVAAVLALLALTASCSTFLARPHILVLPLTLVWSWYLFERVRLKQPPHIAALVILILWTNLHASFTLGWIIAAFAVLSYAEETRLKDKRGLVKWLVFLALCPVASLIHPYGYKAALMTLAVTSGNEATPFLVEWAPFSAAVDLPNLAILLLMVGLALASGFRTSIAKTLFAAAMLYLFLSHSRFAYLFFAVVPVILAPDIANRFKGLSFEFWKTQKLDRIETIMSDRFSVLRTGLLAATAAIVALVAFAFPIERDPSIAVEKAMAFVREKQITGPVLNAYGLGGALIFNGIPTYIDGRSDQLFQGGFFTRDMRSAQPGGEQLVQEILSTYAIRWSMLRPQDARTTLLDAKPEWKRVYEDQYVVIHQREH